uniref:Uncharacterized protein n=1 Tax=Strombidinopsis acuminata TaxID=141414 RepID=A0A7S3U2Q0_9SPIT
MRDQHLEREEGCLVWQSDFYQVLRHVCIQRFNVYVANQFSVHVYSGRAKSALVLKAVVARELLGDSTETCDPFEKRGTRRALKGFRWKQLPPSLHYLWGGVDEPASSEALLPPPPLINISVGEGVSSEPNSSEELAIPITGAAGTGLADLHRQMAEMKAALSELSTMVMENNTLLCKLVRRDEHHA